MGNLEKKKKINLKWFNDNNIDLVECKMENYISELLKLEEYANLDRELHSVNLELLSTLNDEQLKILRKKENIELQLSSFDTYLAYYLGLKRK